MIGVSLKQAGYQFDDNILLQYAKMKGVWISLPVTIGVLLAAQTTLSTGFEILRKQYPYSYSFPLILGISTLLSFSLVAIGGISSYEFFVGYVGIFLTIIASLVILGLLFRKRYSWLLLVMVICLFIGRIVLKVEMWMYGLIPFISGLIVSSLYDLYYKIQGDKGKFIND